ncbi:toxin-antitoxin system YwqK family antitoxin [Nocardia arizonensis]|uniref:toxin-antitoxin system YwqK family antitoxin n=1 Tax=Nocardia arizonensis TaxID=1141647 RepID=UPI0006D285D6|nr:hypothetical protein [Nocardia arizonensis]
MTDLPVDATDPDLVRGESASRAWYRGEPFTGDVTESDANGALLEYSTYADGALDGLSSLWYPDGADRATRQYDHGVPVDTWNEWYANGQRKQREIYWDSGRLRRRWRWTESGDVLEDTDRERWDKGVDDDAILMDDPRLSSYPDGSRYFLDSEPFSGQVVERADGAPDGVIVALNTYVDGFASGPSRRWYFTGSARGVGAVARNRAVGLWLEWFSDGSPAKQAVFGSDGRLLAQRVWEEPGGAISSPPALVVDGLEQRYRSDNSLEAAGVVVASGPIGTWLHWDAQENVVCEECFDSEGQRVSILRWDAAGNRVE